MTAHGGQFCPPCAVIGHEITHGFDAQGNVRNWWTEEDARYFAGETQKLIQQGDSWQVLPGLHVNGALTTTENLADVGGVALGWSALQTYLRNHPQANRNIQGLSPAQRYFWPGPNCGPTRLRKPCFASP